MVQPVLRAGSRQRDSIVRAGTQTVTALAVAHARFNYHTLNKLGQIALG